MNEYDIAPCDKCKHVPQLTEITGLWYLGCGNCGKLEMARRPATVVENWNALNRRRRQFIIARDATIRKRIADEKRAMSKGGQATAVYQLDITGKRVKRFKSVSELARTLKQPKNTIVGKFYRAKDGKVTIEGVQYERDTVETSPATNGGCNKEEI